MKRMKELEDENRRLKKMYAEERLKAEIAKDNIAKKWRSQLGDGTSTFQQRDEPEGQPLSYH